MSKTRIKQDSKRPPVPTTRLDDLIGCADYSGPPKSIEEMDEGVLREARRRAEKDRSEA